jgi:hypothetical protein
MGIEDNTAGSEDGNLHLQTVEAGTVRDRIFMKGGGEIGFYNGGTERARITSGGYFKASNNGTYVGSTSAYHELKTDANQICAVISNFNASLTTAGILYVTGDRTTTNSTYNLAYFLNGNETGRCFIRDSGNIVNTNNSYGSISDEKTKQDIVDAASQWNDIKGLRVRKFRFKNDPDGFLQIGVVAQEIEEVSPGLIDESPDYEEVEVTDDNGNIKTERIALNTTTKSVKYSVLYMKAVKALQEAMERIEALEAKVAALEGAE